jgi:hypothetical protein
MKEEFATAAGKDLYEWGKSLEDEFYRPQIEAEKQKSETRARGDERSRGSRDGTDDRSDNRRSGAEQRNHSRDRPAGGGSSRSRVGPRP